MQITFDPLVPAEAAAVAKMLDVFGDAQRLVRTIAPDDQPDTGMIPRSEFTGEQLRAAYSAPSSAAPLPPPAPSTAAADLFGTAPVAPQASVPPAPPVPQPPAATAPPAPPVPEAHAGPTSLADLDKNGLPWDERIHAGTKAKNADGSWRQRRGLNDDALVKRVEAELRQLLANNATSAAPLAPTPPAPAAATASVPPPPVIPAGPSAVPVPPAPVGASIPTAPPAAPPASTPAPAIDFAALLKIITSSIASGRLTEAQINEQLQAEGIAPTEIGKLAGDAAACQSVGARLYTLLGGVV